MTAIFEEPIARVLRCPYDGAQIRAVIADDEWKATSFECVDDTCNAVWNEHGYPLQISEVPAYEWH